MLHSSTAPFSCMFASVHTASAALPVLIHAKLSVFKMIGNAYVSDLLQRWLVRGQYAPVWRDGSQCLAGLVRIRWRPCHPWPPAGPAPALAAGNQFGRTGRAGVPAVGGRNGTAGGRRRGQVPA